MEGFSLSDTLLKDILHFAKPFGHREDARSLNLGFGFLYYALVRALRPKHTLVIGSGYGFSVVCFALGIKDNGVGFLSFVDPSYCLLKNGPLATIGGRGMWDEESSVRAHFKRFGVEDLVTHYKLRNDEFFPAYDDFNLPPLDLAFIDGNHAYEEVKYDFTNVLARSRKNTYILLHDTNIYIRELLNHAGVKKWMKSIKKHKEYFEVVNFPFSSGVALVRVIDPAIGKELH
ncbi:MAG: class I SAM-dependent methyltransferase [Thermodesulfobacteriota bacterium]